MRVFCKGLLLPLFLVAMNFSLWTHASKTETEIAMLLKEYQKQYAALALESTHAYWKASISGAEEDFQHAAEKSLAISTYHSDPARYAAFKKTYAAGKNSLSPIDARAAELALLAFESSQLPHDLLKQMTDLASELEQVFQTHRSEINGVPFTNNELLEKLRTERNSEERYAAWDGLKQVGEKVNERIVELTRVRNRAAQTLGFANYWEMSVHYQEYEAKDLLAIFEELDATTRPLFTEMKREMDAELSAKFGIPVSELRPWHYDNPFFQQAPPSSEIDPNVFYEKKTSEEIATISQNYFAAIGLPVDSIMARSSLYEQEGKSQHAFSIDMDRLGDSRILCNLKPTAEWMDTQLHELAHSLYSLHHDFSLPFNLRDPAHIFTTEGVAMLFGALARQPQWMVKYAGVPESQALAATAALKKQRVREQLIFCRWTLVMLHFEREMYQNPEQDLKTLWWDIVEKYQLMQRPPERHQGDWAAKTHFVVAPVYYHNYMLGELYAAQLRAALAEKLETPELGEYFKTKIFAPGATMRWKDFVNETTGKPLSSEAFAKELKSK